MEKHLLMESDGEEQTCAEGSEVWKNKSWREAEINGNADLFKAARSSKMQTAQLQNLQINGHRADKGDTKNKVKSRLRGIEKSGQ